MNLFDYLETLFDKFRNGEICTDTSVPGNARNLSFKELIKDSDACAIFLEKVYNSDYPDNTKKIFNKKEARTSHIIVTWLLGVGLADKFNFSNPIDDLGHYKFNQIWLMTSLVHDYGYFLDERKNPNYTLNNFGEYNLLTDNYSTPIMDQLNDFGKTEDGSLFFSYTYDEIKNYFEYSKDFHKIFDLNPNSVERCDHGIVGGCNYFYKFCKNAVKSFDPPLRTILAINKIACISAAQHNIYKSNNKKYDEYYIKHHLDFLVTNSEVVRVTRKNYILSLLSLVDTIECTKLFSALEDNKNYLHQSTTLKYVNLFFDEKCLCLDYEPLLNYILKERKNEDMKKKLMDHCYNISKLFEWTEFNSIFDEKTMQCKIYYDFIKTK